MEDKLILLSRELGIPVQINKIMDLEKILELDIPDIPAMKMGDRICTYDEIMGGGNLKKLLIKTNNIMKTYK